MIQLNNTVMNVCKVVCKRVQRKSISSTRAGYQLFQLFQIFHPLAAVTRTHPEPVPFPNWCQSGSVGISRTFWRDFWEVQRVSTSSAYRDFAFFGSLKKQRLQNSHIYKLFNFQMLIKSQAPSAGSASATYRILERGGAG